MVKVTVRGIMVAGKTLWSSCRGIGSIRETTPRRRSLIPDTYFGLKQYHVEKLIHCFAHHFLIALMYTGIEFQSSHKYKY